MPFRWKTVINLGVDSIAPGFICTGKVTVILPDKILVAVLGVKTRNPVQRTVVVRQQVGIQADVVPAPVLYIAIGIGVAKLQTKTNVRIGPVFIVAIPGVRI